MAFTPRPNSGSLFKNDRKTKDTHPDYTGTALINGKDMRISAWLKESNGKKFFSLAFTEKEEKPAAKTNDEPPEDSSVPF